jgi:lipoprotein-anchoring transpeptidase ErfK/SrfK
LFSKGTADQSLFATAVKGGSRIAAIAACPTIGPGKQEAADKIWLTKTFDMVSLEFPVTTSAENSGCHGAVGCEMQRLWPVLNHISLVTRNFFGGTTMMRILCATVALMALVAGSTAQAQFFGGPRDVMYSGQNDFQSGVNPIPRETVMFSSGYTPGTIVVNTAERRLYLVLGNGEALRYGIGVGRDGFRWGGVHRITAKKEWPSWTPPRQMIARRPDLPRHMAGGIENPLGARAMYLGSTLYRIHGSNEPETIGQAVSSGCFRMTNDDVADLYDRVSVGATVVVKN